MLGSVCTVVLSLKGLKAWACEFEGFGRQKSKRASDENPASGVRDGCSAALPSLVSFQAGDFRLLSTSLLSTSFLSTSFRQNIDVCASLGCES